MIRDTATRTVLVEGVKADDLLSRLRTAADEMPTMEFGHNMGFAPYIPQTSWSSTLDVQRHVFTEKIFQSIGPTLPLKNSISTQEEYYIPRPFALVTIWTAPSGCAGI